VAAQGGVDVEGPGSHWRVTDNLIVGAKGLGEVIVADGGWLESGTAALGTADGGFGTVVLEGPATWTTADASLGRVAGAIGYVEVAGAGANWSIENSLYLGGDSVTGAGGTATVFVDADGSVSVGSALKTWLDSVVDVTGGGRIVVGNGGLAGDPGTVRVGPGGLLGGIGTIKGEVVNDGGVVAPGFSPGILYVDEFLQAAGVLDMEIAGVTPGDGYDVLDVLGDVTLGGTLRLRFGAGMFPLAGQVFDLIQYGGELSGWFTSVEVLGVTADWLYSWQLDDGVIALLSLSDGRLSVPEPATLALFGLGLAGLPFVRRRKAA